jgi:hypothetical protein
MRRTAFMFVCVLMSILAMFMLREGTAQAQYSCSAGTTCFEGVQTSSDVISVSGTSTACIAGAVTGNDTSTGNGVFGESTSGVGVVGAYDNFSFTVPSGGYGVYGDGASSGVGVAGHSGSSVGIVGLSGTTTIPSGIVSGVVGSGSGTGVYGGYFTAGGTGVYGTAGTYGVQGSTASATAAVYGVDSGSGYGVSGSSSTGHGVYGISTSSDAIDGAASASEKAGVRGTSSNSNGYGVAGVNTDGGNGVAGTSTTTGGTGVYGDGALYGVYGTATTGYGVWGTSTIVGVYGTSTAGDGVSGETATVGVYGVSAGNSASGGTAVYGNATGTGSYAVYAAGNLGYTGNLTHVSDERLKKDIHPLAGSVDRLLSLRGVSYLWKDPSQHGGASGMQRGFIAQEYEKVFPEWVSTTHDGFKTIDTTGLDALEVESIRALKTENDELRARMDRLEAGSNPARAGFTYGNGGWGVAGLALGAFIVSRRKQHAKQA